MSLLSVELKSEPLTVKSKRDLVRIEVVGDRFTGFYSESSDLSNGKVLPDFNFTVDRSVAKLDQSVTDWIAQGAAFIELWRQEDEAQRAADAAKEAQAAAAAQPETP